MNNLNTVLNRLESKVTDFDTLDIDKSGGGVGWHIEHSLLVMDGVINLLIKSDPQNYKWRFNYYRIIVLGFKFIPRGRVKAPRVVRPTENISEDRLRVHFISTRTKLAELKSLTKDHYFEHPFLGNLKLNKAINFLGLHTNHHLKIIDSILKPNYSKQ